MKSPLQTFNRTCGICRGFRRVLEARTPGTGYRFWRWCDRCDVGVQPK